MRIARYDRLFLFRCTYATLASFLVWSLTITIPPTVLAAELPLGLATGSKEAQLAVDGKQWTSLPGSSNPVYEGTMLRTGKGTATLLLKDGTQLELQRGTLVGLSGSRTAPVVKIATGRVFFRVPVTSQTILATPSARYQTKASNRQADAGVIRVATTMTSSADLVGEIIVDQRGSRIALQQGEMLARSLNDPGLHIVKTNQSVYIPQIGSRDAGFSTMLAQVLPGEPAPSGIPAGTVAAYGLDGRSVGYITADGSFVSSPGITANLPNPVPAETIPPDANIPPGAMPIFVVQSPPTYAGYVVGNKLIPYVPTIGAGGVAGAGTGVTVGSVVGLGVGLAAIGLGVGLGVSQSGDGGPASPSTP